MAIVYKMELLPALKEAGYNTSRIRKEKLIGEATLQKFREHGPLNFTDLNKLCSLLSCQPGDILEYVPDETDHEKVIL